MLNKQHSKLMVFLLTAFLSLAILQPAPASAQCVEPPPGLVGWWAGDCDAVDIILRNDGALSNGATTSPGMVGQAFLLDGVDDFVSVPDQPNLRISFELTIEAWIQTNDTTVLQCILSKHQCSFRDQGYTLRLRSISGQLYLEGVFMATPACDFAVGVIRTVDPVFTDDAFHHVAITYVGGGTPVAKL